MGVGLGLVWATAPWNLPGWGSWVPYPPLIPCAGIVLMIAIGERLMPKWRSPTAILYSRAVLRPLNIQRVAIRIWGLTATFGLVAFAYWLLPEYHGIFYEPYWRLLRTLAPLAVLVPFYMAWMDRRIEDTRDDYLIFGGVVLGRWRGVDRTAIARHLSGWTVKAYFLPLMAVYLGNELNSLYAALGHGPGGTLSSYGIGYHLSYTVDLLFCVVGYITTLRLFDTQIRSVEPTVAGWLVALICYQPFYSVIGQFYLQYDDAIYWDNWLQSWPVLRSGWGGAIILLAAVYSISTVAFGLRFSNLTHRGIITEGPYRFTKHPAFIAKNLSWWLISVPFVSDQGLSAALRNCCLLALLNLVYYARARTEERHLSRDPVYVAYALWMNEHGIFRALGRMFPALRYRTERGAGNAGAGSGGAAGHPSGGEPV
jgi:hypothetical protein